MAGTSAYPGALDDNTNLNENLTDNVDTVAAAHQNNQNRAIKELQSKVGITASTATNGKMLLGGSSAGTSEWVTADNSHAHNATTLTGFGHWKVLHTNGSGAAVELGTGADGTVLTSTGTGTAPAWEAIPDSGGTLAVTSSGSITAGNVVVGNTDGTVSTVTSTLQSFSMTTPVVMDATVNNNMQHKMVYDNANNCTAYAYRNSDDSNNIYVSFITESSGTVTVSHTTKIHDATSGGHGYVLTELGYDDHNDVYLAILKNGNTAHMYGLAFTYNGSTVTVGTATVVESTNNSNTDDYVTLAWDTTNNVFHLGLNTYDATNRFTIQPISVSSSRVVTPAASTTIASSSAITNAYFPIFVWDQANAKVFAALQPANASEHYDYYPIAFNGSAYTVGSLTAISGELAYNKQAVYDPTTEQILVAWTSGATGDTKLNVIDMSDDSKGTEVVLDSEYSGGTTATDWDAGNDSWLSSRNQSLFITDASSNFILRGGGTFGSYAVVGTVGSSKSITLNSSNPYYNTLLSSPNNYQSQSNSWDSSSNKLIVGIGAAGTDYKVAALTPAGGATNVQKWIGIAKSSVSTGQALDITVVGGVNESQTSLTVGSTYYVGSNGTLSATAPTADGITTTGMSKLWRKVGKATAATKILVSGLGDTTQTYSD
tara:strand:+ start:1424 stop:3394 length:1971 start_codon:yes stop_codon:yes gene_type:complete